MFAALVLHGHVSSFRGYFSAPGPLYVERSSDVSSTPRTPSPKTVGLPRAVRASCERLAEYGWKPHQFPVIQKQRSWAPIYRYMREQQGVRFHRTRDFKQDYFNSVPPGQPLNLGVASLYRHLHACFVFCFSLSLSLSVSLGRRNGVGGGVWGVRVVARLDGRAARAAPGGLVP